MSLGKLAATQSPVSSALILVDGRSRTVYSRAPLNAFGWAVLGEDGKAPMMTRLICVQNSTKFAEDVLHDTGAPAIALAGCTCSS